MNYCIECKFYHYNTAKKAFECSMGIVRICESPCDSYVEDAMVWVKVPRSHGRLIDADALPIKDEWTSVGTNVIWDAPTVLEASE